jgi:type IV secretory pathway TrbL component
MSHWRESALNLAVTVFVIALALNLAARLILAVLPVLIVIAGIAMLGFLLWSTYQHWRSRW